MKKILFFIIASLTFSEITFSQVSDSIAVSKKADFFKKIKNTKEYLYAVESNSQNVFLNIPFGVYPEKTQIAIKAGDEVYVKFDNTSFLFKMIGLTDSTAVFKRIDKTVNFNYCNAALNFNIGNDIYNYGGYGFWKNNGLIRKFDPKSGEWSIIKTNIEVPQQLFENTNSWFDYKQSLLYTAYQVDVNAALKDNEVMYGKITPISYVFDFNKKDWKSLGRPTDKAIEILKAGRLNLSTYNGLMLLAFEQLYLIDFRNNEVLQYDDNVFAQLYMRITDRNFVYHLNDKLYSCDKYTGAIDSFDLNLKRFKKTGIKIYEPVKDYTWAYMIAGAILLILIFISIRILIEKRVAKLKSVGQETKNFKFEFSDIEKALIQMLLEKSKSNQTATISEINYVLGVKDKNIGLQKKVRSEVFNSVNEKFKLISDWDEPLVQSIRSESDKRYFEYMIRKDMIKEAERVMQE